MKYAKIINGVVAQTQSNLEPGFEIVPDDIIPGMFFDGVNFYPPVNASAFANDLASYRDQVVQKDVYFDNGTETFAVYNDDVTRLRMSQKMNAMLLANDPAETVNWQTSFGYRELTLADLQGLFLACDNWQQKAFNAAKEISDINAVTPYVSFDAAKAAFDEIMAT